MTNARVSKARARPTSANRRDPRRRVALASVLVVVIAVSLMVVVAATRETGSASGRSTDAAAVAAVTQVPEPVLREVAAGHGVSPPVPLPADTPPLESDGKPEVLYIGAEYCPFCASQRWPVIVALSRFGSFTNLQGTESAANDAYPRTQTFTFYGSSFASDALVFTAVETETNQPAVGGGYEPLQEPTQDQLALLAAYDRPPYTTSAGAIPFLMIGNRFVSVGASYDPQLIQGMTRDQIAEALSDPASPVAQAIDGSANVITAAICDATDGAPADVCAAPWMARLRAQLGSAA